MNDRLTVYNRFPWLQVALLSVKVVFADNQELLVRDAIRHTISEDMEVLEVDSAKQVIIIPMKQIKYIACDATVFASKKPG